MVRYDPPSPRPWQWERGANPAPLVSEACSAPRVVPERPADPPMILKRSQLDLIRLQNMADSLEALAPRSPRDTLQQAARLLRTEIALMGGK